MSNIAMNLLVHVTFVQDLSVMKVAVVGVTDDSPFTPAP